ncbi:MAG: hypothetical protein ACETWR_00890 [Anaerolineae bacterium]
MEKTETTIKLDIGDICVLVTSPHRQIIAHVQDRYRHFLSDKEPDFEVEMAFLGDVEPAEFLGVPREIVLDFVERNLAVQRRIEQQDTSSHPVYRQAEDWRQRFHSTVEPDEDHWSRSRPKVSHLDHQILLQRSDFAGCLDMKARRGRNTFRKNMEIIAVESFLRICYSFLAVEQGGLLLHSAGVLRDDNGYIFPGPSGTGKSTIASLATARETILSDEMVVVRKSERGYLVYSTPFYGTNESTEQSIGACLKAAFLPVKDDEVYLKEAKPAQALAKLLASVLFFSQEPSLNRRLMDIANDVVAQVPFYEMHFRRDTSFWGYIEEIEEKGGI